MKILLRPISIHSYFHLFIPQLFLQYCIYFFVFLEVLHSFIRLKLGLNDVRTDITVEI